VSVGSSFTIITDLRPLLNLITPVHSNCRQQFRENVYEKSDIWNKNQLCYIICLYLLLKSQ